MQKTLDNSDMITDKTIPGLDGLRAVAVLAVIAYHLAVFRPGWAGVTLFFCISGFLITGILLDTKTEPRYFRNFYIRRALRIMPVYYLALAASLMLLGSPRGLKDIWAYAIYLQNHIIAGRGWLARAPDYLNHTWSLAVEEQFYLLWPAAVLLCGRRTLVWLCATLACTAPLVRLSFFYEYGNVYMAYASLPSNMDALCLGALLAALARSGLDMRALSARALAAAAVLSAMFLACWRLYGPAHTDYRVFSQLANPAGLILPSALALVFTLLVWGVAYGKGIHVKLLSAKPLAGIGAVSYGLYLYHHICMQAMAALKPSTRAGFCAGTLLLTFAVTLASWFFIEKPLLKLKNKFAPRPPGPAGIEADAAIPVIRPCHYHLFNGKKMVKRVKSVNRAAAEHRDDRRPDLPLKHAAVGQPHKTRAANQRFYLGGDIGKTGRRGEYYAVRRAHLPKKKIKRICGNRALSVFIRRAFEQAAQPRRFSPASCISSVSMPSFPARRTRA